MATKVAAPTDEKLYRVALREALTEEMERDDSVYLIGEDIGKFGGAYRVTEGLLDKFGPQRVVDAPIAEEGFVGAAFGAAWMHPVGSSPWTATSPPPRPPRLRPGRRSIPAVSPTRTMPLPTSASPASTRTSAYASASGAR